MPFSFKQEKKWKVDIEVKFLDIEVSWHKFLDIEVSQEKGTFVTTVYSKPSFKEVHILFEHFLLTVCNFGMASSLAYCFKICSDCIKFYEEPSFLKQCFL